MLTPVPMERVRVIALREDLPGILSSLHEARAMQLEQVERNPSEGFGEPTPRERQRKAADESFRFEGLVTALPPVPFEGQLHFDGIEDVLKKADELEIDEDVRRLKTQIEGIDVRLARNKAYIQSLERISSFSRDLSVLTASALLSGFYAVPKDNYEGFRTELMAASKDGFVESYNTSHGDSMALVAVP